MTARAEWTGRFGTVHLRLCARADGVIRVSRDLDGRFRKNAVSAVCPGPAGSWEHTREEGREIFRTAGIRIVVDGAAGAVAFYREDGKPLLQERQDVPVRLEAAEIRVNVFGDGAPVRETVGADGARASADPAGTKRSRTGVRGRLFFAFQDGEALYGLGSHEEGFGSLRGHTRLLYQHNLKAVVPVLVSTEGWGILFDMGCLMCFHDGREGSFLDVDCTDTADWYFVYGDGSYRSLMRKLRGLTGPAPMLPRYALGFAQSKERYRTAEELAAVAAEYRRRKVPLDMVVQDWQTWPEGQWGLKRLDRERFPRGFAEPVHDMHVRVMLSVWPNLQGDRNEDRNEFIREGCMLGNRSTYDAFLPKAREIYWRQIRENLLPEGIDAWWCDCTEPFEADWHGAERPTDGERMRVNTDEAKKYLDPTAVSLYSLCHAMGMYEGLRKDDGRRRALILTRSSWAGQHRYGAVTWSGDVCGTWETLRRHIPEGLNFMAAGEPWWSCDIGGFFSAAGEPWFRKGGFPGGTADPGYRELFVRWAQYACFLTLMRAHGTDTPREIWRFGDEGDPFYEALALCIRMRYRLLAYQYSLMAETAMEGIPMLRIPALVFPEDPGLRKIGHEMMLGDSVLVCPVTRPMYYSPGGRRILPQDETVPVTLPAGHVWYTPEGTRLYPGGRTVAADARLDRIPVFIRAGAVIPLLPVQQYTDETPDAPVELVVYPGEDGCFAYYDDDGITYDYEKGLYRRVPVTWNDREGRLAFGAQTGEMRTERIFRVRRCGENDVRTVVYTGSPVSVNLQPGRGSAGPG